jgi:tetratricopeptide (TPR) repeat protein
MPQGVEHVGESTVLRSAAVPEPRERSTTSDRSVRVPHRRLPRLGWLAPRGLVLAGLAALTAWHAARPTALGEAEAAYARHDWVTALRRASDRLEHWPPSARAALVAARCLSQLDFAGLAEPDYRRAGRLGPDDLHIRAYGLVRANQRERAVQAYQEILAERPRDVLALRRLAGVLLSQRRLREAADLADRLIAIPEGTVIGFTLSGVVHHRRSEPEDAVVAFERVLALDPDLRAMPLRPPKLFWAYLAQDLLAVGRASDARRYLTRALAGRDDAVLMILLGQAYSEEAKPEEAEQCWRRATTWDPKLPIGWLSLGRLALHRNRLGEAVSLLERAASLAPASYEPVYSLSLAHRHLGHTAEAERLRRQAERLRDQNRAGPPRGVPGVPLSPEL